MDKMIQLNVMRKQHVMQRFWHGHSCTETPNIWYVVCSTLPTLVSPQKTPNYRIVAVAPIQKKHPIVLEARTASTQSRSQTQILHLSRHLRYLLTGTDQTNYGMLGNNRSSGGFQKSTQKSVPKQKERHNRERVRPNI